MKTGLVFGGQVKGNTANKKLEETMEEKEFYTVEEVAKILRLSKDRIYEWLRNGSLRGRRLGLHGSWRIHLSELDRMRGGAEEPKTDGEYKPQRTEVLNHQWLQDDERKPPMACLVYSVHETDKIWGSIHGQELHVIRGTALVRGQEVSVVFDWHKGHWVKAQEDMLADK